jgi:hypothetical protein
MSSNPEDADRREQMENVHESHIPGEDAAERKKRLKDLLYVAHTKERAREYENRSEWADALRLYTEVLKYEPEDEQAQDGVKRTQDSLLIQLYAKGMEQLDAGEWKPAVDTFDQLLQEVERARLDDYQDARARRQEAHARVVAAQHFTQATQAFLAGDLWEAKRLFEMTLAKDPFYPRASEQLSLVEQQISEKYKWLPFVRQIIVKRSPMPLVVGGIALLIVLGAVFWTVGQLGNPTSTMVAVVSSSPTATVTDQAITRLTETPEPSPSPDTPTHIILTETPPAGSPPTSGPTETPTPTGNTPTSQPVTDTPTFAPATDTPTTRPATDTSTLQPTLSGKIAVPVFDTNAGAYGVYIARAEEGWQPKLFFENGSQPAFSPDGRQIVLRSWRKAEEGFGQRLVLFPSLKVDAGDERLMTYNLEDAHPSLGRNGDIVFHTRREGAPILVTLGTWPGAESDIANQQKLGPGENPDWLGNRIVYYAPGSPSGLYVINADGSNVQLALSEPGPLAPAAAPDGDHVAVSLQRERRWHVFAFSVSQGQTSLVQLTTGNADDQLPVWSPDGKSIAFVSNRGGKWAVWVMPAPSAQAPWPAGASQDGQVNSDGSIQRKLFDLNGPIDGKVSIAPNMSYGWGEERLSWAP